MGIQGYIALHCIFSFVCRTLDEIYVVLIEIVLVKGSRTSDFFTPETVNKHILPPLLTVFGPPPGLYPSLYL